MKVRPFSLIGASVLASVQSGAAQAVRAWAADWGVAPDALVLRAQRAFEVGAASAGTAWSRAGAPERGAYFFWPADTADALAKLIFPADTGHAPAAAPPQLVPGAARQALEALGATLAAALAGSPERSACQAPSAPHYGRGGGAVVLTIGIGRSQAMVLLEHGCLRALPGVPRREPMAQLAPVDYQAALADVGVTLDLTIGAARVGLGNLMTLSVGDVIRLDTAVDQALAVTVPSGAALLSGYMGKTGDQLAVELTRLN